MLAKTDSPLQGFTGTLSGAGMAMDYARELLAGLGAQVVSEPGPASVEPALSWARSGLMALTGPSEGEPRLCPFPLTACADGVVAALNAIAPRALALEGAALLGERAAAAGHRRAGAAAPGGSCRLLRTGDGWLALNLARPDDWTLLPAWLERDVTPDWEAVAAALANLSATVLESRGRMLGLALAAMRSLPETPTPWYAQMLRVSNAQSQPRAREPLVVDLSALWAGPLCGHLLQRLGARVLKVESLQRPDGARRGPAAFFDVLNAGKASVALDFDSERGRAQLQALLRRADIVIEASRPRALRQLGIDAEQLLVENPGKTWISITGYGRDEPQAGWVGFGDDTGVAAGLSHALLDLTGEPLVCGDAIADPLTGLHAALLAWSSFIGGGGRLLALALRDVVAFCARFEYPGSTEALRERYVSWQRLLQASRASIEPPRLRPASEVARAFGADTEAVLREFGITC